MSRRLSLTAVHLLICPYFGHPAILAPRSGKMRMIQAVSWKHHGMQELLPVGGKLWDWPVARVRAVFQMGGAGDGAACCGMKREWWVLLGLA